MPTLERAGMGGIVILSGFSGNGFRIGTDLFPDGLIIWPEAASAWEAPPLEDLEAGDFAAADAARPPLDLLLVGTGRQLRRLPKALSASLNAKGIGVESMDSRAAARTYNLLAGEGRRVGAALYPLNA